MGKFFERLCRQWGFKFALLMAGLFMMVALLTPFVANDKPLIVIYQQNAYFPIIKDYPETSFGGVFDTPADYTDPVVVSLISQDGMMVMPPVPYGENSLVLNPPTPHPSAPTMENWWGTDALGRDVFVRTLYGLRLSLLFGVGLTVISSVIGLAVGSAMGYFGGWVDLLGQRVVEIWLGLPQLFILMMFASVFESSLQMVFVAMLLFGWLPLVALSRVHIYRLRGASFVMTAKNLGVPAHRLIYRHFLPSLLRLNLAQFPFILAGNITVLTALDFLGVGLPMNVASLGELLHQAVRHLDAPHLMMASVGVLGVILVVLMVIGEACRKALQVGDE
ncbi:MAG: ABC transporter permease subunit [Moraxella sp.]|nr:ABC transporter permease subunit [Moraxella sp.]